MTEIKFEVLGEPKALKRHRTFRRGNFVGNYDPSANDKNDFLRLAHEHAPEKPLDCPLMMNVAFYFPHPKSHYRTGKNSGELKLGIQELHTKRPDIDNLLKFIADALNGVYFRDDSCICTCHAVKRYSERPRTEILIREI